MCFRCLGVPRVDQSYRYAAGLLLISPLRDLVRRRPLMLLLVFLTTTMSIGLTVTSNLVVFEALSFLVGVFSVVPQILTHSPPTWPLRTAEPLPFPSCLQPSSSVFYTLESLAASSLSSRPGGSPYMSLSPFRLRCSPACTGCCQTTPQRTRS
jgi:hypothetical protein